MKYPIGPKLKELRLARGLHQKDIAKALEVDRTTILSWESGRTTPDELKLKKLSLIFDTDLLTFHMKHTRVSSGEGINIYGESSAAGDETKGHPGSWFAGAAGALRVGNDDAMTPKYPPGCIVIFGDIDQDPELIMYGEDYVIILRDDRKLLRRLEEPTREGYIKMTCYNPAKAAQEIPLKGNRIYCVLGKIEIITPR